MSKVERNGVSGKRPSWNYIGVIGNRAIELDTLEMVESLRNVCEQIRDSQMLACDVAMAIKRSGSDTTSLLREIRGLRRDMKKLFQVKGDGE